MVVHTEDSGDDPLSFLRSLIQRRIYYMQEVMQGRIPKGIFLYAT